MSRIAPKGQLAAARVAGTRTLINVSNIFTTAKANCTIVTISIWNKNKYKDIFVFEKEFFCILFVEKMFLEKKSESASALKVSQHTDSPFA